MIGEVGERRLGRTGRQPLDHLGRTSMHPDAPRCRQAVVQGIPDERVMEVEAARPARRFVHELRLPGLVDRVEKEVVRDLGEGLQDVEVELPAEDGGEGERAHTRLAQARHAPEDDVAEPPPAGPPPGPFR